MQSPNIFMSLTNRHETLKQMRQQQLAASGLRLVSELAVPNDVGNVLDPRCESSTDGEPLNLRLRPRMNNNIQLTNSNQSFEMNETTRGRRNSILTRRKSFDSATQSGASILIQDTSPNHKMRGPIKNDFSRFQHQQVMKYTNKKVNKKYLKAPLPFNQKQGLQISNRQRRQSEFQLILESYSSNSITPTHNNKSKQVNPVDPSINIKVTVSTPLTSNAEISKSNTQLTPIINHQCGIQELANAYFNEVPTKTGPQEVAEPSQMPLIALNEDLQYDFLQRIQSDLKAPVKQQQLQAKIRQNNITEMSRQAPAKINFSKFTSSLDNQAMSQILNFKMKVRNSFLPNSNGTSLYHKPINGLNHKSRNTKSRFNSQMHQNYSKFYQTKQNLNSKQNIFTSMIPPKQRKFNINTIKLDKIQLDPVQDFRPGKRQGLKIRRKGGLY